MNIDAIREAYSRHVAGLRSAYDAALSTHGFDAVVIHSGSAKKRTDFDDQYWPVRPVPHFQHWAALSEPDAVLVVRAGVKPTLYRIDRFDFWEHPYAPESDHFFAHFEVRGVGEIEAVKAELPSGRVAFVSDDPSRAALLGFTLEQLNPPSLVRALDAMRTVKSEYEVMCLAIANERAARGHDAVLRAFSSGASVELSLHLAYLDATSQDDPETPYKNIVALGAHAATLHHVSYARGASRPGAPESLLLDAGATCFGYCSDITRTWVRGNGATVDAFRALVDGVEAMQQRLCAAVSAGNGYESLHDRSHDELGEVLSRVGIVRVSGAEAVARGITRAFYPHGLGHSLGLQCHDVGCALTKPRGDNPFLRNTSVIAEGQVFTIEPGAYFIGGLLTPLREGPDSSAVDWSLVDALAPFGGVRIEDDVVVRGAGEGNIRNLTREVLSRGGGSV